MITRASAPNQLPLIHIIESDDLYLQHQPEVVWFDVLSKLGYRQFRTTAARYYEGLWRFNQQQAKQRQQRRQNAAPPNPETQEQATQRLLFNRPTLNKDAEVLYQSPSPEACETSIDPQSLRPGVTPPRFAGRVPKCFFAMLNSFVGVIHSGQPGEPEFVYEKLQENPSFARACGFTIPRPGEPPRASDIPSLRKLQQFDQIMRDNGLWEELALQQVADNLRNGVVKPEPVIIHDTTHYHAFSEMKVVELDPPVVETPVVEIVEKSSSTTQTPAVNSTETSTGASTESEPVSSDKPKPVAVGGPSVAIGRIKVKRVPLESLDEEKQAEYWRNREAQASSDQASSDQASSNPASSSQASSVNTCPGKTSSKEKVGPRQTTKTKRRKSKPSNSNGDKPKKDKQEEKEKKSHPRTTKNCRCADREHCPHVWISADEGAGTVVKSSGRMYWAHKASTLSFANQEVLLDAVALNDAASHDSRSLLPHLSRLFDRHPDLQDIVTRVLDDGAADDSKLKEEIKTRFGIELLAPINTRRRGPIHDDLPHGIDHLTARGRPVCQAGYSFEYLGFRQSTERFIFTAPKVEGERVCLGCALRDGCYRGEKGGRQVTIAADRVPWLDREMPQLSKRFAKAMARRTVIERIHKLMKFDFGDARLTKRGTPAFQARLDKTLLAMHIFLAHSK